MSNKKPQKRKTERTVEFLPDFELPRKRVRAAAPRPPAPEVVQVALTPVMRWIEPTKRERGGNSSGLPASPMNDVEIEIARADAAFLIQKEKESGDWDKWLKDQAHWKERDDITRRRIVDIPERDQGPIVRTRRTRSK